MGLDMYLHARKYISNWREEDKPIQAAIKAAVPDIGDMNVRTVICEAAYWRKANHIHKWFVDNVQKGVDDCGSYYVDRADLELLRDTCKKVLANHDQAVKLLPTRSGFFFGDTSYSEDYYEDVKYTAERIDQLLTEQYKDWDFEYHSSW